MNKIQKNSGFTGGQGNIVSLPVQAATFFAREQTLKTVQDGGTTSGEGTGRVDMGDRNIDAYVQAYQTREGDE